jgi:hypothetical protein
MIIYCKQEKEKFTASRENGHRADMMVVGHRVVHIGEVVVHTAVVLVVGHIDLVVAVDKAPVVEAAAHMVVEQAVDHIDFETGGTEKSSGRVVVAAVCCILTDFEDRVMMLRRDLDLEVEDRAPEVVLGIQDVKA